MTFRFPFVLLPSALLIFLIAGCGGTIPEPQMPAPAPELPVVDGGDLPSIEVVELVTDVPGGRLLGWHYEGEDYRRGQEYVWDESFRNRTSVLNELTVRVLEEAGYELSRSDPRRVRLTAVMRKVTYNSYARRERFNQATCEVRWQLYRMGEKLPFATLETAGEGRADDIQAGAVVAAYELALRRLLAGAEFAEALKSR